MSDHAQGADWWLASDGKWYPPTSVPGYATHSAAGPVPVLSATLAAWLQATFWISSAIAAIGSGLVIATVQRFDAWWDAPLGNDAAEYDAWLSVEDAMIGVNAIRIVVSLAAVILLMVWMFKAHKVTSWLNPSPRRWTAGWTIGGWFIPFANFVIPKLVLNEIERLAASVRDPRADGRDWKKLPTLRVGWVWWLLNIFAVIAGQASVSGMDAAVDQFPLDPDGVRSAYYWGLAGTLSWVVAGLAGGLYVPAMTRSITGAT